MQNLSHQSLVHVAANIGDTTPNPGIVCWAWSTVTSSPVFWDGAKWGSTNGVTNLTSALTSTTVTINSDTGTDAVIPAANGTNAGVMPSSAFTKLASIPSGVLLANKAISASGLAIGNNAAYSNTSANTYFNAIGNQAAYSNSQGGFFQAIGSNAALSNANGSHFLAIGHNAVASNTIGNGFIGLGTNSAVSNIDGSGFVAAGNNAGYFNEHGDDWIAIGRLSANYQADGTTPATSFDRGVYIGRATTATQGATNEISIGFGAKGAGSNTATIGNSSVTDVYLAGKVHAGVAFDIPKCTTSTRPSAGINDRLKVWDTTLGAEITWNGTAWRQTTTTEA